MSSKICFIKAGIKENCVERSVSASCLFTSSLCFLDTKFLVGSLLVATFSFSHNIMINTLLPK